MKRREFITLLSGTAAAWPLAARAQQAGSTRLIGVLMGPPESDPTAQSGLAAFRAALTKLGWTEGSNFRMELRWGAGDPNRIGTLAKELVDLRPDVILGHTTPAVAALAHETRTIPIVFPGVVDPIGSGFGASLAHPGGNITGFSTLEPEVGGKWIELLKEIAPHTERVALLFNPATTVPIRLFMPSIETAASSFAIQVNTAPVHAKEAIEGVVAEQARNAGAGLIVLPDVFFVGNQENRELLISLAARYHVPTIYSNPIFAKPGGLICYGTGFAELFRLGAGYVDRILKGEHPADLPIQQPNKYQLSINLKTAKALGLSVSSTLLATADEVIE